MNIIKASNIIVDLMRDNNIKNVRLYKDYYLEKGVKSHILSDAYNSHIEFLILDRGFRPSPYGYITVDDSDFSDVSNITNGNWKFLIRDGHRYYFGKHNAKGDIIKSKAIGIIIGPKSYGYVLSYALRSDYVNVIIGTEQDDNSSHIFGSVIDYLKEYKKLNIFIGL